MVSKDDKPSKGESSLRSSSEPEKQGPLELQQLQELYALMLSEGLDSLELKEDDSRIRLSRKLTFAAGPHPTAPVVAQLPTGPSTPATPATPEFPSHLQQIQAPLAGVFYRASSPTSAPFAKEGDVVDSGQTLCIIEAMKVMNEIKAESRCKISRIVAENSRPVTAGQPLFLVEPP